MQRTLAGALPLAFRSPWRVQFHHGAGARIASVGTGQTWDQVYEKLALFNVSVAGGRITGPGIGGFTLGGGYSWLTPEVGNTCDTVTE
jgi:FAD/FMN-containing dehydrogenase